jgi:two-component system, NtrC family, nitrogen regulation sensor histidine kinase GlnL
MDVDDPSAPPQLVEHLLDGVVVVREGRVTWASGPAAEVLGRSVRALVGAPVSESLPDEAEEVIARVLAGAGSCTVRGVHKRPPGVGRVSISGTPGPSVDQVVLAISVDKDPARQAAVAGFRRRLAWLESLAAGMAHEIRNPLAGIRGAAQLLRRESTPRDVDELTELIIQESDRIHVQVERLMELCRPKPLRRSPVDLNVLVQQEATAARTRSGDGLTLRLDVDPSLPPIEGDVERLAEAVGNLLKNACEAATSNVIVRTRVDAGGRLVTPGIDRGPTLRIDVEDDGPGIHPDRLSTVFAPFETTKAGGSGLGLFVARLAVEAHSGLVQVDGRPGEGARFSMLLSLRLPPRDDVPDDPWVGRVPMEVSP